MKIRSLASLLILCLVSISLAQTTPMMNTPLPLDPSVRTGMLPNGIKYFIKKNQRPENRVELRLAVNAGAVQENDDQQGLAHFCEHMAFNGSKHFQKNELVNYLESIGVRFGADLNAYTSFDETVYMLQLPTDTAAIMDRGFQVLEDWAHYVSYDDEEIDKERGVVIEEWRIGRGANARMEDKQFPIIFKGSKYGERLPIGKKSILESCTHDVLRKFYHDWYRTDLMCVCAVGDFDMDQIEKEIKDHFTSIPASTGPARIAVPVPDAAETRYAIATDPEASGSEVEVMFKQPVHQVRTIGEYRDQIVQGLYSSMFNARLNELKEQANPPFIYAYSSKARYVRNAEFYVLGAGVNNGGLIRGLETLLTEAERVRKFGFMETELDRAKKELLRSVDKSYDERDKTDSRQHVGQLVSLFLRNDPYPDAEFRHRTYQDLVPGITVKEINALASTLITDKNRIVSVNAPEKPDVKVPTKEELAAVFTAAQNKQITAYVDRVVNKPILDKPPMRKPVIEEDSIPELGITKWTLGNGVKVILKPTDFKNDELLMTAFRPGGTSVASDADFLSADEAAEIVGGSGLGEFDQTALKKALAGRIVSVSPNFSETHDLVSGQCSPKDMQMLFMLTYMTFTQPRKDNEQFNSFISRQRGELQNRNAEPQAAFQDTLEVTMGSYHPRRQPFTEASLANVHLDNAYEFYKNRFADANGFTFVFVGNFTPASIKPLVEMYLGGLPSNHREDMWKDVGVHPPTGVIEKSVRKGIEQKSTVQMLFTGPLDWSPVNRWKLQSMCNALSIKLREQLREEKGGVYGVSAYPQPAHQPRDEYTIRIGFPCAPTRVDELTKQTMLIIDSIQKFGVPESYVHKIQELQLRDRETSLKQNRFWLQVLQQYYMTGEDPHLLLGYKDLVKTLSSDIIRDAAKTYLNTGNYVKVALYPEK